MIDIQDITRAVREELGEGDLFLVDVKVSAGNEIDVFVDCDGVAESSADGAAGVGGSVGVGLRARGVSVEDCAALARAIEARFDREVEDFSLTVSSAGIGQPLRVARQYKKLVGRQVEVVLTDGTKILAVLEKVETGLDGGSGDLGGSGGSGEGGFGSSDGFGEGASITLSYPEKRKIEGKKRPEIVSVTRIFPLGEVKTTKEYIDFK